MAAQATTKDDIASQLTRPVEEQLMSQRNPSAFSPATFATIFSSDPKYQIEILDTKSRWFDMFTKDDGAKRAAIAAAAHTLGSIDTIATTDAAEAAAWYSKHNMGTLIPSPDTLYMGSLFDFKMMWTREGTPGDIHVDDQTHSSSRFEGLDLRFESEEFTQRGAYLPAPEGTYAWVCMVDTPSAKGDGEPAAPIGDVASLMDFVAKVEATEAAAKTGVGRSAGVSIWGRPPVEPTQFHLNVPNFAVRSDIEDDPDLRETLTLVNGTPAKIGTSRYSNRIVFNNKGAFMRSAMATGLCIRTCIAEPKPEQYVTINKSFVFVASSVDAGPLFAIYVPMIYWELIEGDSMAVLESLNQAVWGQYLPKSLSDSSAAQDDVVQAYEPVTRELYEGVNPGVMTDEEFMTYRAKERARIEGIYPPVSPIRVAPGPAVESVPGPVVNPVQVIPVSSPSNVFPAGVSIHATHAAPVTHSWTAPSGAFSLTFLPSQ